MPDRALRPVRRTVIPLPPCPSPNASNARQGIKTPASSVLLVDRDFSSPNASNARQGIKTSWRSPQRSLGVLPNVRTPPMPDRALRRTADTTGESWGTFVRTPPMPDRALRPGLRVQRHPSHLNCPNASNARQGIKTEMGNPPMSSGGFGPNASNARQGIKTYFKRGMGILPGIVRTPPMPDRALRPRVPAFSAACFRSRSVRTPPMPDRALRLLLQQCKQLRNSLRPNASNARQGIKTGSSRNPLGSILRGSERLQCPTGH